MIKSIEGGATIGNGPVREWSTLPSSDRGVHIEGRQIKNVGLLPRKESLLLFSSTQMRKIKEQLI